MGYYKALLILLQLDYLWLEGNSIAISKFQLIIWPQEIIFRRLLLRSVPYKDYIKYDYYIITDTKSTKYHTSEDLLPSHISSHKKKLIMMPRSHFEDRFILYYNSIHNASLNDKDYCTYFFDKEREHKRKIYFTTNICL